MDALKRAERARRETAHGATAASDPAPAAEPTQEPSSGAPVEARPPSDMATRLELLEERLEPGGTAAHVPDDGELVREREAARNLFEAKPAPARHGLYFGMALLALAAAAALAGYVWIETRPNSGIGLPAALRAPKPEPIVTAPPRAPAPAATPAAPPAAALPPTAASADATAPPSPAPAATAAARAQGLLAARRAPPDGAQASADEAPPQARAAPAVPRPASPRIAVRVTTAHPRVNPDLAAAYALYQSGELERAGAAYRQVLQSEPNNRDALHGLAAIALQNGDAQTAQEYRLRALEADPTDAAAMAALIELHSAADPVRTESRLKTLIATAPHAAAAHFALGNLHAANGRWAQAQQSYFAAYTAEPANADYRYNLAVSLDQLRQSALALRFYRGALEAAANGPAAFDRSQVEARVRELRQ